MALYVHRKGFTIPKPYQIVKPLFWRQKWVAGVLFIVRRVPPGTIIAVLFSTKYAVPCQIKPGNLKITISCEGKGYYRVISVGQLSFDYRLYCGRSRRMQGALQGHRCHGRCIQLDAAGLPLGMKTNDRLQG